MPEDKLLSYRKSEEGVALFIDWENLKIGLFENNKTSPDIDLLLETVDKYGQRGASKAYANWQHHSHLHDDQSRFLMRSVETVQILGRNPNSGRVIKNSADVAMAVEAVRLCYTQPDLTTFVLVTGDGDLIHLVNELKRNRNKVVIIGVGTSVSKVLSEAADEVLFYERDLISKTLENEKDALNDVEISTVYNWIEAILRDKGQDMPLPALGQQLWRKYGFAAKQLNMSLSDLAEEMATAGRIDLINEKVSIAKSTTKQPLTQINDNVSLQVENPSLWQRLKEHQIRKDVLKVKISEALETGLKGQLEAINVEAFLPNNQLGLRRAETPSMYVGQIIDARVIGVNNTQKHVLLSRLSIQTQELAKVRQEVLASLKVNDIVKGKVVDLTDFGAFVDLGGLDGLVHRSELSYTRIQHPQQVVSIGDEIEAKVVSIDSYKGRVSLSIKSLQDDPWYDVVKLYPIGKQVIATVTNVVSYGVFVELEKGLSALIHISELGQKVNHPSEILQKGQEVKTTVISIDETKKRLALRLKQETSSLETSSKLESNLNLPIEANEPSKSNTKQHLVFESKKIPKLSAKRNNLKVESSLQEDRIAQRAKNTSETLVSNTSPENGEMIESNFEVATNLEATTNLMVPAHDSNVGEALKGSLENSQEIRWLVNFLSKYSHPHPLQEIFKGLSEEYGLKQPAFKASIKKAHKDGLIKLVRHTKSKKLYATLTEKFKLGR